MLPGDSADNRKLRGAYFTPYAIAEHLADWALRGLGNEGLVLDPTCGEGVFLLAAGMQLVRQGRSGRLLGVDLHGDSLAETKRLLAAQGSRDAELLTGDFFQELTPLQLGARLPYVDAVIGNPPFVRYHQHRGDVRKRATAAALAQGVRLSGLASSWAALLVHASAFLKPSGRMAMVLPAELLSVGYAEPIRQWLRRRFSSVHLVLFDRLQFADAEEQVVLLVARGSGGCNAFTLHHVESADELAELHIYDADAFAPRDVGKWTDLLIPEQARGLLRTTVDAHFDVLRSYGTVELGTVTGANKYFTLSDATRKEYGLVESRHVDRVVPPGSRHVPGLRFTEGHWQQLKLEGSRVWLLNPRVAPVPGSGLARYLEVGRALGVHEAYKCSLRQDWWVPPVVPVPDFFFTYMSHSTPRLISNLARATLVNSMHGVTIDSDLKTEVQEALPLVLLNTVTMLCAEVQGRSYGGGILKMEPREAASLPLPRPASVAAAWTRLQGRREQLENLVRLGCWSQVTQEVDEVVLLQSGVVGREQLDVLRAALLRRRARRQGRQSAE